jgi:hypothetical protein
VAPLPWKRLGDLLGGPLRGRTVGDVEVNDPARAVSEHHEDEQDLKVTVGTTRSPRRRGPSRGSRGSRHVGEGGFLVLTMYLSTVDLATSIPSLASSSPVRKCKPGAHFRPRAFAPPGRAASSASRPSSSPAATKPSALAPSPRLTPSSGARCAARSRSASAGRSVRDGPSLFFSHFEHTGRTWSAGHSPPGRVPPIRGREGFRD